MSAILTPKPLFDDDSQIHYIGSQLLVDQGISGISGI